jgi:hypothetical protein
MATDQLETALSDDDVPAGRNVESENTAERRVGNEAGHGRRAGFVVQVLRSTVRDRR